MSFVYSDDDGVISLIWFKSELLLWLDTLFSHNVDLASKDLSSRSSRIDTVCLDGNDDRTTVLQKVVGVESDNSGLIRLSDICENDIDHLNEHSVFLRMSRIFNDWDDICSLFGHSNQISSWSMREFDGVNDSFRSDDIGDV